MRLRRPGCKQPGPPAQIDTTTAAHELEQAQGRRATNEHDLSEKAKAIARARAQIHVGSHGGA